MNAKKARRLRKYLETKSNMESDGLRRRGPDASTKKGFQIILEPKCKRAVYQKMKRGNDGD